MRTFERYINRKRIGDIKAYLESRGLNSDEEVKAWCTSQEIEPPLASYFADGKPEISEVPESSDTKKTVHEESDEAKTWHVPAAERPLRKSAKSGKKSTVSRKKSSHK